MKFFKDIKELESLINQIDFTAMGDKLVFLLKTILKDAPQEDRKTLIAWVAQVQAIRNNQSLSDSEKVSQIENLETGAVVMRFLSALSETWMDRIPFPPKNLLKAGISGFGMWAAGKRPAVTAVGVLAFQKFFPKFLLSQQGDRFLVIVRELLQDEAVADDKLQIR